MAPPLSGSGTPASMLHGSPVGGLTVLDPAFCVVDPAAWAGTDAASIKVTDPVIWLTSSRDIAIAFSLKRFVKDLGIDARSGIIYFLRDGPLPDDASGWLYTVDAGPHIHHARGPEWFSTQRLHPLRCEQVTVADLQTMRVQVIDRL